MNISQSQNEEIWGQLLPIQLQFVPIELNTKSFSVGRDKECNLPINDHRVSSVHCRIYRARAGEYLLQDLSSNGTYINDTKIGKSQVTKLTPGDIIYIVHESLVEDNTFIGFVFSITEDETLKYKLAKEIEKKIIWGKLNFFNCDKDRQSLYLQSYSIGRAPDNDIVIDDIRLSRYHCRVFRDHKGQVYCEDRSANGTFLEDDIIGKGNVIRLNPGQRLYLLHTSKVAPEEILGCVFIYTFEQQQSESLSKQERSLVELQRKASIKQEQQQQQHVNSKRRRATMIVKEEFDDDFDDDSTGGANTHSNLSSLDLQSIRKEDSGYGQHVRKSYIVSNGSASVPKFVKHEFDDPDQFCFKGKNFWEMKASRGYENP